MSLRRTVHPNTIYNLPRSFRGCLKYSILSSSPPPAGEAGTAHSHTTEAARKRIPPAADGCNPDEEESALARRFTAMAEDAVLSSPHKTPDSSTTAAISDDLKSALLSRVAAAEFSSTHARAISISALPSSASKHTRDLAATRPWDGTESQEDAVLRMLTDAHKPLRQKPIPQTVDLRPHSTFGPRPARAERVAGARDGALEYSLTKDANLSSDERAQVRAMFCERFQPAGRPMAAASVSALMSLADQRIEDARARGQFDNIPRGQPRVEDHNARSPFLDTTEYFLNKMIRKQEILPPWVEKQQELGREAEGFRVRIRSDWKRRVARGIAARGGTLEDMCARAERYAQAEARRVKLTRVEKMLQLGEEVSEEETAAAYAPGPTEVFRDAEWEKTELKYNQLCIDNLNSLCRSYNMMAPEIARKPIFTLERELDRCFADVAPQVAEEILERARRPELPKMTVKGKERSGLVGSLGIGEAHQAKVYDSEKPNYGFKDFWKDLFGRKEAS